MNARAGPPPAAQHDLAPPPRRAAGPAGRAAPLVRQRRRCSSARTRATWKAPRSGAGRDQARSGGRQVEPGAQHADQLQRLVRRARQDAARPARRRRPPPRPARPAPPPSPGARPPRTRTGPPRPALATRLTDGAVPARPVHARRAATGPPSTRRPAAAGRSGRSPAARATSWALSRPARPGRTSACPPCRPAGARRRTATASMTGSVVRPMPVAEKVVPSGRSPAPAATSAWRGARHAARHAHHEVDVHVPAVRQAVLVRAAAAGRPGGRGRRSRTPARSPRSCIRVCSSTMNSQRLRKTSSPKLTVPMVQQAMSGPASSTASRSASGSVTAPPVDSWTIRSVVSRSAATVSRSRPRSSVGRAPRRRGCGRGSRWRRAPRTPWRWRPARRASPAAPDASALADSAPVGATVINVRRGMPRSWHARTGRRRSTGPGRNTRRWRTAALRPGAGTAGPRACSRRHAGSPPCHPDTSGSSPSRRWRRPGW